MTAPRPAVVSGYVHCNCRDCFEIAIAGAGETDEIALCSDCDEAGCEANAGECLASPFCEVAS